jgi:hypothetical protein
MGFLDALKEKTKEWSLPNWIYFACICILAIIALTGMIMQADAARKIHVAYKTGEMMQQSCGSEYMEIETARYNVNKALNEEVGKQITDSIQVWSTVGLLAIVGILFITAFDTWKARGNKNWILWTTCAVLVLIVAYLGLYIYFWVNQMGIDKYTGLKVDFVDTKTSSSIASQLSLNIPMVVIILAWFAFFYSENGDNTTFSIKHISLLCALIIFSLPFIIHTSNKLTSLKAWSASYTTQTATVESILDDTQKDSADLDVKQKVQSMLQQNIKRFDTGLDGDPRLSDKYKDQFYAYVMHQGGLEGRFLGNSVGITSANVNAIMNILNKRIETLIPQQAANLKAKLADAITATFAEKRSKGSNSLYQMDIENIFNTQITEQYNNILFADGLATALADYKTQHPNALTIAEVREFIRGYFFREDVISNGESRMYNAFIANENILSYLHYGTATFDFDLVDMNGLIRTITAMQPGTSLKSKNITTTLLEDLKHALKIQTSDMLKSTDSTQSQFVTAMRGMRKARIDSEANKFVQSVFWLSIVFLAVVLFVGYHLLYIYNKETMNIAMSILVLALIFIFSWYGWFMGKIFL